VARASYEPFDDAWRSAFEYADVMTPTPGVVSPAAFSTLERHWSAAQIVELTSVICIFNFFNRFANALDIPVTR
jgi:alkylhydroperoxidase family enzyme